MVAMNSLKSNTAGWFGTISSFLKLAESDLVNSLQAHHLNCMLEPASALQVEAWKNCHKALQTYLPKFTKRNVNALNFTIIFEYVLPRERGRRPDVIILADATIFVLEFKDYYLPAQAHIDQVSAYVSTL